MKFRDEAESKTQELHKIQQAVINDSAMELVNIQSVTEEGRKEMERLKGDLNKWAKGVQEKLDSAGPNSGQYPGWKGKLTNAKECPVGQLKDGVSRAEFCH